MRMHLEKLVGKVVKDSAGKKAGRLEEVVDASGKARCGTKGSGEGAALAQPVEDRSPDAIICESGEAHAAPGVVPLGGFD